MIDWARNEMAERDNLRRALFEIWDTYVGAVNIRPRPRAADEPVRRGRPANPYPLSAEEKAQWKADEKLERAGILPEMWDRLRAYCKLFREHSPERQPNRTPQRQSNRTPKEITDLALRCTALDCRDYERVQIDRLKRRIESDRQSSRKWQRLFGRPLDTVSKSERKAVERAAGMTEEELVQAWVERLINFGKNRARHRQRHGSP